MTTPQQTRVALAEIPSRLEALRMVGHTPTQRNPEEPIPATRTTPIMTQADNAANLPLSQDFNVSRLPSPDELVIRQRGRRHFTTTFSPDKLKTPARSPFQRTPTKNLTLTSGMILRSSPRKRLTMGSTPPDPMPVETYSPMKTLQNREQMWPGTPIIKKLRMDDEHQPIARTNSDVPLAVMLQGLSQQQLVELIMCNVKVEDPLLTAAAEEKIRAQLPMSDISDMEIELLHAKRLIFKSLPTSRLCKKTDASAYSKAALHLNEFKRLLQMHAKRLHDSAHWDALVDYVCLAWRCVASTPKWESSAHNTIRRQCFKILACYLIAAIKHGGQRLGQARLEALEINLREWLKDYEDVLSCINALQKTLAKARTSL